MVLTIPQRVFIVEEYLKSNIVIDKFREKIYERRKCEL